MAAQGRRADASLTDRLFREPYRFEFFQAVRLLERIFPKRKPVGRDNEPAGEVARFRTRVSLNFPASQVHQLTQDGAGDDTRPAQMMVTFMGLTGPLGVLPHPYTELLIERTRYKDTALWAFLDIFNHRVISLFYRAWAKHRFPVAYERGEEDRFTEYLFDLMGLGTPGLRRRTGELAKGLPFYSGLVAQRPHSAAGVAAVLGDFFGVPVKVEQFFGQWLHLEADSLTRLGRANSHLGVSAIVGRRVWDCQSKFRLQFGPLTFKDFLSLLPVGTAFNPARELTRLMAGLEYDFDFQLTLKAEEVPRTVLTTRAKRRPLLGWTTWLKTKEFTHDDSQVVLATEGN